ncbi:MAG: glycosyltransferase, partial [Actinomycetes bacterium]
MVHALWFTDVQPREVRRHLGLPPDHGPQAWVDRLAEELSGRADVKLEIASPGAKPYEPFTASGIRYCDLPAPLEQSRMRRVADGWRHRLSSPATLAAAGDLIRTVRPEVIHIHGTESAFGTVAVSSTATPCVISLQGLLQQYQRLYFAGRTVGEMARLLASAEFLKGRGEVHGYLGMRAMAGREAEVMRRGRYFIGRTDWDRA